MSVKGGITWADMDLIERQLGRIVRAAGDLREAEVRGCSSSVLAALRSAETQAVRRVLTGLGQFHAPRCAECDYDLAEDGSCEHCADEATA